MTHRLAPLGHFTSTLLLAALFAAGAAFGAPPPAPDAGALQQQIEKDLERPPPVITRPPESAPAVAAPAPTGVTVTVSRVEFAGNTLLTGEQLQPAVQRFLNRPLTFDELQAIVVAVSEAFRDAGWVVRVFLPPQELKNGGTVRIEIVEARFGEVFVQAVKEGQSPESLRVKPDHLRGMVFVQQKKGAPVSSPAVDRALLLLDDLPGVAVRGSLAAGKGESETDLSLAVANEPAFSGDVRIDNTGSRSTGSSRLLGNLAWKSPAGIGDLATANILVTEGSSYGRLAYRRPVGYDGWAVGVNASDMNYHLIGADYSALDASGSATTVGLECSYPLLRSGKANLNFSAAPEHKGYANESGGITTTSYSIDAVPLTLSGNRSDSFGGGGNFSGNVAITWGDVDLSGSPNAFADKLTTKTDGSYSKLRYQVTRQQTLNAKAFLRASLSGQFANKNLDSAEKFYLGGANGVRAYPSSDGGGSDGRMLNLELYARLPKNFSPFAFYDDGQIRINHDNTFPGAPTLNSYSLRGAGLGLGWSHPKGINAKATWARRLGDNPNATPAGKDQDGTLIRNRIWAEVSAAF